MFDVRQVTLKDCRGIAQVQVYSYRTAYAGIFPEPYLEHFTYEEEEQDWARLLATGAEDVLLVAVSSEGQVVGYILARAKPDIYSGYDSEIVALHVKQAFQRKGIGTALLKEALQRLAERQCKSVMLWTLKENPIRQWYERLQGEVVGEKQYQVDDWIITEIAYGWDTLSILEAIWPH